MLMQFCMYNNPIMFVKELYVLNYIYDVHFQLTVVHFKLKHFYFKLKVLQSKLTFTEYRIKIISSRFGNFARDFLN